MTMVISLDGNIGAGKSTLLEAIRVGLPEVEVVVEPVGEWTRLKNTEGKSLLELFYEDKRRWAYTFQNCAILTRLRSLKSVLRSTTKKIVITERSVLTDRYVFAEMLRSSGNLDDIEWSLYNQWFDTYASEAPVDRIIYLTTGVGTSADRIMARRRDGEGGIPRSYLAALEAQHETWLESTDLPVLRLSTEADASVTQNLEAIRTFLGLNSPT